MKLKIGYPFRGSFPITFKFGEAPDWYVKRFGYPHNGVDFGLPIGTPVLACDAGTVIFADSVPDANGCGVILGHKWGQSLYWHLKDVFVRAGQEVKKGDVLGLSGQTGFATGPHLHFGVKVRGCFVEGMKGWCNPLDFLEVGGVQPPSQVVKKRFYWVRPGDSLWKIAKKFYGSGFEWRRIYEANREKIKDPALIYPLQKLWIP